MGVAGVEARRKVGDATPEGVDGGTRELGARRVFGVVAEEGAAAEGPRCVHAAALLLGQEGAGAELGHRQSVAGALGPRSREGLGTEGVPYFFELDRARIRLATGDSEVAAPGDRNRVAIRRRTGPVRGILSHAGF